MRAVLQGWAEQVNHQSGDGSNDGEQAECPDPDVPRRAQPAVVADVPGSAHADITGGPVRGTCQRRLAIESPNFQDRGPSGPIRTRAARRRDRERLPAARTIRGAMAPHTRIERLAPRLLLLFAVLFCLLGLGQSVAAATESAPEPAAIAAASPAGHGAHQASGSVVSTTPVQAPAEPEGGHGSHSPGTDHGLTCMASSATAVIGVLALPDAAALVRAVIAPASRLRTAVFAVAYPRPPDIATLCVQRI